MMKKASLVLAIILLIGFANFRIGVIPANAELEPILNTFTTVMESKTTDWDTEIGGPFVIYDAGLYKMWHLAVSQPWPGRRVIAYAESNDGITWFNKQVVHGPTGISYHNSRSPWVAKEGGTYRMWHSDYYEWVAGEWSAYIAHMTSSDGVSWPAFMSADDQKVLSAQGQDGVPQGDGYLIVHACVIHEPSGYVMWYTVGDVHVPGGGYKVWRATSTDGITWTNRQLSLPYVPDTWEDSVWHASVVKEDDGTYTMFYAASYGTAWTSSIGMAKSSDGITWTDRRQILTASDLGVNVLFYDVDPYHFKDLDGKRYLYISYSDNSDGKTKIGRIQLRVVVPPIVSATPDVNPDTLNLKSNGEFVTAYIELPAGYNVADIDLSTVKLEGIPAITDPKYSFVTDPSQYLVDHDGDGIMERMVKFDRATLRDTLTGMIDVDSGVKFYELTLKVTGEVAGIPFEGTDTITVIKK